MTGSRPASSYSRSLVIPAEIGTIFQLLSNPASHHLFDASTMVGAPSSGTRLTRVGQVFVMNMTFGSGEGRDHYKSDNHVTAIATPTLIAWATATHGGDPLGWHWCYKLEQTAAGTLVRLTYDWSETPPHNVERYGVPLVDEEGLSASLALLSALIISQE